MLLIALLPGKLPDRQQVFYSSPIQLAHYARVKLNEYNAVAYPNWLIPKKHKPENLNCPHPHLVELESLENSKKSLKALFTQLVIDGNQDNLTWPDVFPHILKTMVTERVHCLYRKQEASLLKEFGTPFATLMGLINNQISVVNQKRIKEIIDKITPKERHPTGENTTAVLQSTQLPWRTEHTHGDVPGQVPRNVRDSTIKTLSPPSVPKNVVPSKSL